MNDIIYGIYNSPEMAADLLIDSSSRGKRFSDCQSYIEYLKSLFDLPQELVDILSKKMKIRDDEENRKWTAQIQISKKHAAKMLDISHNKLMTYINQNIIAWPTTSNTREPKAPLEILNKVRGKNTPFFGPEKIALPESYIDIATASEELLIHSEYVRSLLNLKWLKSEKLLIDGSLKTAILKKDLIEFDEKYVLVGTYAKELNVNSTNLAEKLQSMQILPIGGPKIDGLKTTIFQRSNLKNITTETIINIKKYKTKTGRKPKDYNKPEKNPSSSIGIPEASTILGLSQQKVSTLVRLGILLRDSTDISKVSICYLSVQFLKNQLSSPQLINIDRACELIGCTKAWLYLNIVNRRLIKIYDYRYWKLILDTDVNNIKQIKEKYFTAYEGSIFLGRHRCHINNLKKQGIIKPYHAPFDDDKRLDLYLKQDVEALRSNSIN